MGARQSVAQPVTRQSAPGSSNDQGLSSLSPSANGHNNSDEPSTSSGGLGGSGARPRLILQSTSSSSHQRPRQTRSRSMTTTTPPQIQAEAAALIAALNQQRRRQNRMALAAATGVGGSSDQSSESGDDNDGATAATMRSLDRLLMFSSVGAHSSSVGQRIWVPPVTFPTFDIKCPVCNKTVPFDDVELHLVVCLTRPRIAYNEEILTEDRGECVICFDEMSHGDTIARLPCLCVYHKTCIDGWFKVKNCCPAHPGDDD